MKFIDMNENYINLEKICFLQKASYLYNNIKTSYVIEIHFSGKTLFEYHFDTLINRYTYWIMKNQTQIFELLLKDLEKNNG